jgi:hypothetical protein
MKGAGGVAMGPNHVAGGFANPPNFNLNDMAPARNNNNVGYMIPNPLFNACSTMMGPGTNMSGVITNNINPMGNMTGFIGGDGFGHTGIAIPPAPTVADLSEYLVHPHLLVPTIAQAPTTLTDVCLPLCDADVPSPGSSFNLENLQDTVSCPIQTSQELNAAIQQIRGNKDEVMQPAPPAAGPSGVRDVSHSLACTNPAPVVTLSPCPYLCHVVCCLQYLRYPVDELHTPTDEHAGDPDTHQQTN